jgi:ribonuclease M5
VVEGKYDKERLKKITDAPIIVTGGFALYRDKKIINSIIAAAKMTGIIILTDSDGAGFRIRNYIKQCVGKSGKILNAYIPSVEGKEKRKEKAGKEGILGVEGMNEELLLKILENTTEVIESPPENEVVLTKAMLYEDGLTGKEDSEALRKKLTKALLLPPRLSANGIIEIINRVYGYDAYKKALERIKGE